MSGFFSPAAAKMSITPSGRDGPRDDLADRRGRAPPRPAVAPASDLARAASHGLEEADVVADGERLVVRARRGRRPCDSSRHGLQRAAPCRPPARGRAPAPPGRSDSRSAGVPVVQRDQSKPWNRPQQTSCFSSITATASSWSMAGLARAAALGVGRERLLQLVGEAEVVDHQPARLVLKTRLTRAMACISPWPRIGLSTYIVCRDGASKPVSHMSRTMTSLKRVVRVLEALGERLAARLGADVRLPVERVAGRAGHHDLDRPLRRRPRRATRAAARRSRRRGRRRCGGSCRRSSPCRPSPRGGPRSASRCPAATSSSRFSAPTSASSCAHLRLELLLALDLLALGHLLELGVDVRALVLVEVELGEAALVVDRDGGAVLDGPLDVVDADVVAEDGARVLVGPARWACR